MLTENPEDMDEESSLIASAPLHARLTQKQRRALIFLAFAVPFWVVLSLLAMADHILMLVFLGGLFFLVIMYGMRTEYLLFLWFAVEEYSILLKAMGIAVFGIGIKGVFLAAVLSQLPNKFALMPRRLFRTVPVRWPLYMLLVWVGVSMFWSDYGMYGFRLYMRWVTGFFAYAMVFLTINDRNKHLFFIVFVLIMSSSISFGLLQRFGFGMALPDTDLFTSVERLAAGGGSMLRVSGFSGHPNMLGRECVFTFCVLLLMLLAWRPRLIWRGAILGMMGITLAVVVLSYSRISWALFAVGVGTFILVARPRWALPMAAAGGVVALLAWPQIWARLEPVVQGTDISLASRAAASEVYMDYWKLRPLTGHGLGSTGGGALYEVGIMPHEGYVYLLSNFGIIGLLLYVWLLIVLLRHACRTVRDRLVRVDQDLRAMAVLGLAVTAIMALNFVVGIALYMPTWYLLGATFGTLRIAQSRHQKQAMPAAGGAP